MIGKSTRLGKIWLPVAAVALVGMMSSHLVSSALAQESPLLVLDFKYQSESNELFRNFEMQVPSDWEAQKDYGGYALVLRPLEKPVPTERNPVVADPSLTVAVRNTPMPIDAQQVEDYAKEIEKNMKETLGERAGVEIFQKQLLENLSGGNKGLLYYVRYNSGEHTIMNSILIMSNESVMYRVTFTDYEVTFSQNLDRYFPVMASLSINGSAPVRESPFAPVIPWLVGGAGLMVLLGGTMVFHRIRLRRMMMGEGYSGGNDDFEESSVGEEDAYQSDIVEKAESAPPPSHNDHEPETQPVSSSNRKRAQNSDVQWPED